MAISHWALLLLTQSLAFVMATSTVGPLIYYIKPTNDTNCPTSDNCHTMDNLFLLVRGMWRLNSTTELRLLPGEHQFNSAHSLVIEGMHNLTIQSASQQLSPSLTSAVHTQGNNSPTRSASIICRKTRAGFNFQELSSMLIKNIHFHNCSIDSTCVKNFEMSHGFSQNAILTETYGQITIRDQTFVDSFIVVEHSNVTLQNCSFTSSQTSTEKRLRYINSVRTNLSIEDSIFSGATYSAVSTISSYLYISGKTVFSNNSGKQGGAVALHDSYMILLDGAEVLFLNNHATSVGGGVFATNGVLDKYLLYIGLSQDHSVSEPCSVVCLQRTTNLSVSFINNTAIDGGNATYGVTLDNFVCNPGRCPVHHPSLLREMFTFEPDGPSLISSDPLRVCICPNNSTTPDCSIQNQTLAEPVLPGRSFTVRTAVVGLVYGTVRSTVTAELWYPSSTSTLGADFEDFQTVFGCTNVEYKVHSNRTEEVLVLGTSRSLSEANEPPAYVEARTKQSADKLVHILPQETFKSALFVGVRIQDCPPGFERSQATPIHCKCDAELERNGFSEEQCDVTSQAITRNGTVWLSYGNNTGVVVHKHCPFGYCRPEQTEVDLHYPDTQCTQNRTGVLCGGCETGLSIALGSSDCVPCTDKHLALLPVFIAAGVVLVFLIKTLNLTVSVGTINGLIFYANVVGANRAVFFPTGHTITRILTVFISWLNLDFGIETCFYDGLDSYWKTWLQFAFPLYIWSIAIAIIIVARHSERFTRLLGNNSVPVLATLLLLSYGKLLRASIAVFSFAQINYQNGSTHLAWAVDGNVPYLGQRHVALFVMTSAAVLFLWMPYTLFLLSGHSIRKCTSHERLSWMLKLQLFFDAYHGPFKHHHVHWVGTLLATRVVLYITFAAFFANETSVNLLSISLGTAVLLMYTPLFGIPYNKKWQAALECSFLLNLGILSSGTFYIEMTGGRGRDWLVGISVGVAFLQFLGILVYHSSEFTRLQHAAKAVASALKTRFRSRGDFVRLEATSQETLNELDVDIRETERQVTMTVIDPPRNEVPLSKMQEHYSDHYITGTQYTT